MDTTSAPTARRVNPLYREIAFWATRRPIHELIDQQADLCRVCIEVGSLNAAYLAARRAGHLAMMESR